MYESSVVHYFTEKALKQGIEQGVRACAVEDLLDVLAIRFELVASDPLAVRLGAIDDMQASSSCIGRLYRCRASKLLGTY